MHEEIEITSLDRINETKKLTDYLNSEEGRTCIVKALREGLDAVRVLSRLRKVTPEMMRTPFNI